jgi:hypothetical protein
MKREVVYESDTVLPDEIRGILEAAREYILADMHETDKMVCHFAWLRSRVVGWFANHTKEKEI